jgi:hypothetical protein
LLSINIFHDSHIFAIVENHKRSAISVN